MEVAHGAKPLRYGPESDSENSIAVPTGNHAPTASHADRHNRRSPENLKLLGLRITAIQYVASGVFWFVKVGHTPCTWAQWNKVNLRTRPDLSAVDRRCERVRLVITVDEYSGVFVMAGPACRARLHSVERWHSRDGWGAGALCESHPRVS
ncbi:hypothetical protein EVAR_54955_1 [Eumeta japonica]|uniref:Uncharacterized protein n=1 Tax=Eumeta variegata TaxID=151549 RepID=A0A4C1YJG3_EUMVA|nr:hypothetical protein EVAR_54955_1 [Eumeta japonica]